MGHSKLLTLAAALGIACTLPACGSKSASFALLADQNEFVQNAIPGKVDILWVIDNSGSMKSSQENVAQNFQSFINEFNRKGFDYRIAVITSDAYRSLFTTNTLIAKFKDGTNQTAHTNVFVIEPTTPNLMNTFMVNILQGIYGSGDERVFQSIKAGLDSPHNAGLGFLRPDAFLSVIIVSDEDDFSHNGAESRDGQYSYSGLHKVSSYAEYLDGLKNVTPENRKSKYNVNSITILDTPCLNLLNSQSPGRRLGTRYVALSEATGGVIGSLCSDFGVTLASITDKIIELTTQFYLDRIPRVETISVVVNGEQVPRLEQTSPTPWNGYLYHADTNSVTFHGTSVPKAGSSIKVDFDPVTLK